VFLLAGQSNMDGRAEIAAAPPQWSVPQEDVLFFYRNIVGWVPLQHGSASPPGTSTNFGPELSFGRSLADHYSDEQIALIKHAKGGTSLYDSWAPGTGNEYRALSTKIRNGLMGLEAEGYAPTIRGMIWMQGETDALYLYTAEVYEANLTAFIAAIRGLVGISNMPFVIGRINAPEFEYRDLVRDAQMNAALADPFVHTFSTDDLPLRDHVHYDAVGMIELGQRFAQGMTDLLSVWAPPSLGLPALGPWGLLAAATLILTVGTVGIRRRRREP
jgi:iduronate 2-sulfatase